MSNDIINFYKNASDTEEPVKEEVILEEIKPEPIEISEDDPLQAVFQTLVENLQKTKASEFNKPIEEIVEESNEEPFAKFLGNVANIIKEDSKLQTDEQIKEATIGFINKIKDEDLNPTEEKKRRSSYAPAKLLKNYPKKRGSKLPIIEPKEEVKEEPVVEEVEEVPTVRNAYVKELKTRDDKVRKVHTPSKPTDLKTLVEKKVREEIDKFSQHFAQISMTAGGGGSVAVQYADGGTMRGDLNVTGKYLSGGRDLATLFSKGGGGGSPTNQLSANGYTLTLNNDGSVTFPDNIIRAEYDQPITLVSESVNDIYYTGIALSPYAFYAYDNAGNNIYFNSTDNNVVIETVSAYPWTFDHNGVFTGPNNVFTVGGTISALGPILSGGKNLIDIFTSNQPYTFVNATSSIQPKIGKNTALGCYSNIGGGTSNKATDCYSAVGGGQYNITIGCYTTIGGGLSGTASGRYATVSGGYKNTASLYYAVVAGGSSNIAENTLATIGGGQFNRANGAVATIAGGEYNTASGVYAFIGGGSTNCTCGNCSTISGGYNNCALGKSSTIVGGVSGTASGDYSFVGGGYCNNTNSYVGVVVGGHHNCTGSYDNSAVVGGWCNFAQGDTSFIGGGACNFANTSYGVIAGGFKNSSSGYYGTTISGGYCNTTSSYACFSTIGGGCCNTTGSVYGYGTFAVIAGGMNNTNSGNYTFIGGGRSNCIDSVIDSSVIGGFNNSVFASSSIIGGGCYNTIGINSSIRNGGQAFWNLNESSGNRLETIGIGGNTLYQYNTVPSTVGINKNGIIGNGSGWLETTNTLNFAGDFTINYWTIPNTDGTVQQFSGEDGVGLNFNVTNISIYYGIPNVDTYLTYSPPGGISTSKWSMATLTRSGDTVNMYLNGVLVGTNVDNTNYTSVIALLALPGGAYVGNSTGAKVDELSFWGYTALTQDQITSLYKVNPYLSYPFSQSNGNIGGGYNNSIFSNNSFVAGGSANIAGYDNTFILGSNIIALSANYTYVNNIQSLGLVTTNTVSTSSLRIGNSTTVSTALSSSKTSRRIQIFDQNGASLGYIPVYATI